MKIYQVINLGKYPASTDHNKDAIFLSKENAQEYIDYLIDECGINPEDLKFNILTEQKVNYFIISDPENNNPIGIIKNIGEDSRQFESAIMTAFCEHYVADDCRIENSLNIRDFIGESKTVQITLLNEGEEEQIYDVEITSCLTY